MGVDIGVDKSKGNRHQLNYQYITTYKTLPIKNRVYQFESYKLSS